MGGIEQGHAWGIWRAGERARHLGVGKKGGRKAPSARSGKERSRGRMTHTAMAQGGAQRGESRQADRGAGGAVAERAAGWGKKDGASERRVHAGR